MQDAAQAAEIIDSLSLQGLKIAIDDFGGTGYSSLAYLKRFRISRLKVTVRSCGILQPTLTMPPSWPP